MAATACCAVLLALILVGCSNDESADATSSNNEPAKATPVAFSSLPDNSVSSVSNKASLSHLEVTFIDVGQGDCELLHLPDGRWMLIDAGDSEHAQTVIDHLRDAGVKTIDFLVATHPHADHIGAMPEIIRSFDIGELWMPNASEDTKTFNDLLDAIEQRGVTVKQAKAGETIVPSTAGYEVSLLGPSADTSSDDLNDYSAVIKVTYGSNSMLFCGDAPADSIIADDPGRVNLLKAAHHGSKTGTTSALLDVLAPQYVVMSYAESNSYGHPDQEVLDAIEAAGATAYGTGAQGDIVADSDGKTIHVSTEHEGKVISGKSTAGEGRDDNAQASSQEHPAPSKKQSQQEQETVYVTASGSKYHLKSCRTLKRAKRLTAMSKQDAIEAGYEACKVCNP